MRKPKTEQRFVQWGKTVSFAGEFASLELLQCAYSSEPLGARMEWCRDVACSEAVLALRNVSNRPNHTGDHMDGP